MTTLDEQMAAIERLALGDVQERCPLPWTSHGGTVIDEQQDDEADFMTETGASYAVACANAALDLCAEVRRLREVNAYLETRYKGACMSLSEALDRVEDLETGETA